MDEEKGGMRSVRAWAKDIRAGQVGAEELARFYLARIRQYDGPQGLNAVCELNPQALQQARELDGRKPSDSQPLYGIPVLVKDNIDVCGLHTAAGSLALADRIARADAPVIAALKRQGAIILGKTNMTEFANFTTQGMPNGYSSRGGQVKSAYGPGRSPSGSSSGSAVAVSAGLCAAAIGTDTSFSVIQCAAENGVVGLKPPVGALSGEGILPIAHSLDSAGVLARDFGDALLLYAGMGGRMQQPQPLPPKRLKIAVNDFNLQLVSPAQLQRYEALCKRLRAAGAVFSRISQPVVPFMRTLMRYEFRHDLEAYLAGGDGGCKSLSQIVAFYEADPRRMPYGITSLKAALEGPSGRLDDEEYLRALSERESLRRQTLCQLEEYDACIMTGPTNVMHVAGLPSLSLPLCMAQDGAPRGMILYGADEGRLYAAALAIERFCEGARAPSPEDWRRGPDERL